MAASTKGNSQEICFQVQKSCSAFEHLEIIFSVLKNLNIRAPGSLRTGGEPHCSAPQEIAKAADSLTSRSDLGPPAFSCSSLPSPTSPYLPHSHLLLVALPCSSSASPAPLTPPHTSPILPTLIVPEMDKGYLPQASPHALQVRRRTLVQ